MTYIIRNIGYRVCWHTITITNQILSWRDSFSKLSVRWSWLWNVVWSVKNVICLLLSWRNYLDRVVMASEAIVMCLLLSWRDSFSKLSAWWSWLWNVVRPVKNVLCLLLSWRNCFDEVVVARKAIVICLLLSSRDFFRLIIYLMIMTVKYCMATV